IGRAFSAEEMPGVIQRLIEVYLKERSDEERFIDTVRRLGIAPFKAHVYAEKTNGEKNGAEKATA
ncbi:MAG TPA: hypothetical protein VGD04_10450, partial [Methylophilus sp.]